jgi:hypothetical protein
MLECKQLPLPGGVQGGYPSRCCSDACEIEPPCGTARRICTGSLPPPTSRLRCSGTLCGTNVRTMTRNHGVTSRLYYGIDTVDRGISFWRRRKVITSDWSSVDHFDSSHQPGSTDFTGIKCHGDGEKKVDDCIRAPRTECRCPERQIIVQSRLHSQRWTWGLR